MKKIASLTQTYGQRTVEMHTGFKNNARINLFKKLDLVTFNFHNVPFGWEQGYGQVIHSKFPHYLCRSYRDVPYGFTLRDSLQKLQAEGYTDVLFCQDDHFFVDHPYSDMILTRILDFYRSREDINILYVSPSTEIGSPYLEEVFLLGNLSCRKENTLNWNKIPHSCAYDDSPYFANINFLLKNVFTEAMVDKDVWFIEQTTAQLWKTRPVIRWTCNSSLGYLGNFSGRNISQRYSAEEKIAQITGESPSEHSLAIDRMALSFPR